MNYFWLGVAAGFGSGFMLGIALAFLVVRDGIKAQKTIAYKEGRDVAIDAAAMAAYDLGHPEVRDAINALVDGHRLHERAGHRHAEEKVSQ